MSKSGALGLLIRRTSRVTIVDRYSSNHVSSRSHSALHLLNQRARQRTSSTSSRGHTTIKTRQSHLHEHHISHSSLTIDLSHDRAYSGVSTSSNLIFEFIARRFSVCIISSGSSAFGARSLFFLRCFKQCYWHGLGEAKGSFG